MASGVMELKKRSTLIKEEIHTYRKAKNRGDKSMVALMTTYSTEQSWETEMARHPEEGKKELEVHGNTRDAQLPL
jgi:hypothetical protein